MQRVKKGGGTMVVTATEFKTNFGKYLDLLPSEDIFITRNGKTIAKVVDPHVSAVDSLSGLLAGKAAEDLDRKSIREERIGRYAIDD
jgi:antitoxin (DNA-binding transcriptional repressor) of toxin-antitoxin stability system